MNIKALGIAVLILLMGVGISQLHIGEQNNALFQIAPSQNLDYSTAIHSTTYPYPGIGNVNVHLNRLSGTYLLNNHNVVLSSLTPSGDSSIFSDSLCFNFTQTGEQWTISGNPGFKLEIYATYELENTNGNIEQSNTVYSTTTATMGVYAAGSTGALEVINNGYFIGEVSGLVIVNINMTVCDYDNAYYDYFAPFTVHLTTENYLEPSGGSLSINSQYNGIIQDNSTVNINYVTQYSSGYQIIVYGSKAYNNGQILKTYDVKANSNSYVQFTLPSNAWVKDAGPTGNLWKVTLNNNLMGLATVEFFSVDHYNYMPGTPTIIIKNQPNGDWTVGQTVYVELHSTPNNITNASITSFVVFVYTSNTQTDGQNYILNGVSIPATNNYGNFSFTIQNNELNFYIQASAYDSQGRNSPMGTVSIQASQIKNQNETLFPVQLTLEVVLGIMAIAGSLLFYLYLPYDPLSKVIIIMSYLIALAMIYVGAGGII